MERKETSVNSTFRNFVRRMARIRSVNLEDQPNPLASSLAKTEEQRRPIHCL